MMKRNIILCEVKRITPLEIVSKWRNGNMYSCNLYICKFEPYLGLDSVIKEDRLSGIVWYCAGLENQSSRRSQVQILPQPLDIESFIHFITYQIQVKLAPIKRGPPVSIHKKRCTRECKSHSMQLEDNKEIVNYFLFLTSFLAFMFSLIFDPS